MNIISLISFIFYININKINISDVYKFILKYLEYYIKCRILHMASMSLMGYEAGVTVTLFLQELDRRIR
jgi:hypothetical protein